MATVKIGYRTYELSPAQVAAEPDSLIAELARSSSTIELRVDQRLAPIWLRWLNGNHTMPTKPVRGMQLDEMLAGLLRDARKLRIASLVAALAPKATQPAVASPPVRSRGKGKKKSVVKKEAAKREPETAMDKFWTHEPLLRRLLKAVSDDLVTHVALLQTNRSLRGLYKDCSDVKAEEVWATYLVRAGFGVPVRWKKSTLAHFKESNRYVACAIVHHARKCRLQRCKDSLTRVCTSRKRRARSDSADKHAAGLNDIWFAQLQEDDEDDDEIDYGFDRYDGGDPDDYGFVWQWEAATKGLRLPLCGKATQAYFQDSGHRIRVFDHIALALSLFLERSCCFATFDLFSGTHDIEVSGSRATDAADDADLYDFYLDRGITIERVLHEIAAYAREFIDPNEETFNGKSYGSLTIPLGDLEPDEQDHSDGLDDASFSWDPNEDDALERFRALYPL